MRLFLIILVCCCGAEVSLALSYGTPSSMLTEAMASNMDYLRETGKKVPRTWDEMEVLFGGPMDEKFPNVTPTRRYAFITNEVQLADGRVLLIMRSPFRDIRLYTAWYGGIAHGLRERGRWAVLQDAKSAIRARYVLEDTVVAAFARAGVPLPAPDGLGEWPHEVEHRHARNLNILIGCLGFGVAFGILMALRVGQANKRMHSTPR